MIADLMGSGAAAAAGAGGAATGLFVVKEYWWLWLPGILLFVATLCWVAVGGAWRDRADPRAAWGRGPSAERPSAHS